MPKESVCVRGNFAAAMKGVMGLALVFGAAQPAAAQIVYNSIPSPLPPSVASVGLEAASVKEFGDGLVFTPGTQRGLMTVKAIMDDWACSSGNWFNPVGTPNPCVTSPAGATFSQAITIKIYGVIPGSPPSPGALIFSKTSTFDVPYRPSSDAVHCPVTSPPGATDGEEWYSPQDGMCHHGLAFQIAFDFSGDNVVLPNQAIVTLSYNTTHYGPNPVGEGAPCFTASGGCPYDSLNISADSSFGGATVGSVLDPNGVFVNYYFSNLGCSQPNPVNVLFDDTSPGCWTGNHPQIQVDTTPLDAYQVGYAANLAAGDSFIDLTSAGGVSGTDPIGDICANIYVFAADQQMIACCSCPLTPNHLTGVSVRNDLISKTLTVGAPAAVSIALTASINTPCNAAQAVNFAPGLRAWGVTLHQAPGGSFVETETKFQIASPSISELSKLTTYCGFIQANGSGYGICDSCSPSSSGGGGGGGGTVGTPQ